MPSYIVSLLALVYLDASRPICFNFVLLFLEDFQGYFHTSASKLRFSHIIALLYHNFYHGSGFDLAKCCRQKLNQRSPILFLSDSRHAVVYIFCWLLESKVTSLAFNHKYRSKKLNGKGLKQCETFDELARNRWLLIQTKIHTTFDKA